MADKPLYYGGESKKPMYYGGTSGRMSYGGTIAYKTDISPETMKITSSLPSIQTAHRL